EWEEEVWRRLPPLQNREATFGPQFVVDAAGEWLRTEERLLATSAAISLEEAVAGIHARGGLAIAAHAERPSFSIVANLGFVPPGLAVDALEVTPGGAARTTMGTAAEWETLRGWPWVVGGDAHRLGEIARRTCLWAEAATLDELKLALQGKKGRRIEISS
ncbi:MAG: histidinol-phosphatase, partial [bacterium]|nr:histidinol-phosphatase [bacterium]